MNGIITKASAAVSPGEDDDQSTHGTFTVVLSTPTRDRDGEEVKSDEWELPLPDHITFDVDHGMSVASTVGSGVPTIDGDGRLIVAGRYASTPLAQQTRALVKEGHIRTTSVAFLRKKTDNEKDGTTRPLRELLNGAFVAVPANREALVLDAKAAEAARKVGARNSMTDAEHLQAAHDSIVSAGASCPTMGKSVALAPIVELPAGDDLDAIVTALNAGDVAAALALLTGTSEPTTPPAAATDADPASATADETADEAASHAAAMHAVHVAALRAIHDHV